jgi:hypothetical protein
MAYVPYVFTDAQLTDIRRFCGFPAVANGSVLFPAPWINVQYLALDYRLQTLSATEGAVVVNNYLANLYTLESSIVNASANLGTEHAAVWKRNKHEVRDRTNLFNDWRRALCDFMGVQPGPGLQSSGGVSFVV